MDPSILTSHTESMEAVAAWLPSYAFLLIAVCCYFAGNINPAILIGRIYGVDVTSEGSGNAGMTNAMRTIGKRAGIITFIVDVLKGLICTVAVSHFVGVSFGMICGILVIIGHIFPAVFKFKGGKGVATTFGVMLAYDWRLALILIAIVVFFAFITKRVSAGTLVGCVCALPLSYFLSPVELLPTAAIIALIVFGHRANIGRLIAGNEPKMSFGNKEKV